MSTNLDLCKDAYRFIGVVGDGQTPSAEQGVKWLRKANQLLAMEAESGIQIPSWYPQTSTADTCPIPDYAERWLYTATGLAMATDYGVTVTAEMVSEYESARAVVLRKKLYQRLTPIQPNIPAAEADWNAYSILNG